MFDYMYFPVKKKKKERKKNYTYWLFVYLLGAVPQNYLSSVSQAIVLSKAPEGLIVKAMVFPAVMYRCEWAIKKVEHKG